MAILIVALVVVGVVGVAVATHFMTATIAPPEEAATAIDIDAPATRLEGTRYLEYRVGRSIEATPETVWKHLTDAAAMPAWNSAVVSIEGDIADNSRIKLVSSVAPERAFSLAVSFPAPGRMMIWQDGNRAFKGVRTFTIAPTDSGCDVTMAEVLTGVFLPMIGPKLPDFRASFDTFIGDLATTCES